MKIVALINWLDELKKLNPDKRQLNAIISHFKKGLTESGTEDVIEEFASPILLQIIECNREIITEALKNISYDEAKKQINSPPIDKIKYPNKTAGMILEDLKLKSDKKIGQYENEEILFIIFSLGIYAYLRNCVGMEQLDVTSAFKIALAIILPPVAMIAGIVSLFFKPNSIQQTEPKVAIANTI